MPDVRTLIQQYTDEPATLPKKGVIITAKDGRKFKVVPKKGFHPEFPTDKQHPNLANMDRWKLNTLGTDETKLKYLENLGYQAHLNQDGQFALRKAGQKRYHVVDESGLSFKDVPEMSDELASMAMTLIVGGLGEVTGQTLAAGMGPVGKFAGKHLGRGIGGAFGAGGAEAARLRIGEEFGFHPSREDFRRNVVTEAVIGGAAELAAPAIGRGVGKLVHGGTRVAKKAAQKVADRFIPEKLLKLVDRLAKGTYTKPIPDGAKIVTKGKKRFAHWTPEGGGKVRKDPIVTVNGEDRIKPKGPPARSVSARGAARAGREALESTEGKPFEAVTILRDKTSGTVFDTEKEFLDATGLTRSQMKAIYKREGVKSWDDLKTRIRHWRAKTWDPDLVPEYEGHVGRLAKRLEGHPAHPGAPPTSRQTGTIVRMGGTSKAPVSSRIQQSTEGLTREQRAPLGKVYSTFDPIQKNSFGAAARVHEGKISGFSSGQDGGLGKGTYLSVEQGINPKGTRVHAQGVFQELTEIPSPELIKALQRSGVDGAFIKKSGAPRGPGGLHFHPQLVIWNDDAIIQLGAKAGPRLKAMKKAVTTVKKGIPRAESAAAKAANKIDRAQLPAWMIERRMKDIDVKRDTTIEKVLQKVGLKKGTERVGVHRRQHTQDAGDFIPRDYLPYVELKKGADLDEFLERQAADAGNKLYHVTPAKSKVQKQGLKSQAELLAEYGQTGAPTGLGGAAPKSVSMTYSREHADRIADTLRVAIRAAQGTMKPAAIYKEMSRIFELDHFTALEAFKQITKRLKLANPETTKKLLDDPDDWGAFNTWINKEFGDEGFFDAYRLVQTIDATATFGTDVPGPGGVGLVGKREAMAKLDANDIGIFELAVKKGSKVRHNIGEQEIATDAANVRVLLSKKGFVKKAATAAVRKAQKAPERPTSVSYVGKLFEHTKAPKSLVDIAHRLGASFSYDSLKKMSREELLDQIWLTRRAAVFPRAHPRAQVPKGVALGSVLDLDLKRGNAWKRMSLEGVRYVKLDLGGPWSAVPRGVRPSEYARAIARSLEDLSRGTMRAAEATVARIGRWTGRGAGASWLAGRARDVRKNRALEAGLLVAAGWLLGGYVGRAAMATGVGYLAARGARRLVLTVLKRRRAFTAAVSRLKNGPVRRLLAAVNEIKEPDRYRAALLAVLQVAEVATAVRRELGIRADSGAALER